MELIKMHKGKPMEDKDYGLVVGTVPALITETEDPEITWVGAQFPRKLYLQTVAFAKWCAEEYGGEVQGRLYYSESRKKWRMVVMPQYVSRNLASLEIEKHDKRADALRIVSEGDWRQNGTWHSHAFATAGQSTTDYSDEIKQPGFHYTVGSLSAEESSFHCRYTFRGLMYSLDHGCILRRPHVKPSKCASFPSAWKEMLIEGKRPVTNSPPKYDYSNGYGGSYNPNPSGSISYMGKTMTQAEWSAFISETGYGGVGTAYGLKDDAPLDEFGYDDAMISVFSDAYRERETVVRVLADMAKLVTNFESFEDAILDMAKIINETNEALYNEQAEFGF